jgi:hypothetical protein
MGFSFYPVSQRIRLFSFYERNIFVVVVGLLVHVNDQREGMKVNEWLGNKLLEERLQSVIKFFVYYLWRLHRAALTYITT